MFVELSQMLKAKESLTINVVALDDGQLNLVVIPKTEAKSNPALQQPLQVTASPQELDRDLAGALASFVSARKSLVEQIAASTLIVNAATAKVAEESAKTVNAARTKTAPAKAAPKLPSKTGQQTSERDDGDDTDPDDEGAPNPAPAEAGSASDSLF